MQARFSVSVAWQVDEMFGLFCSHPQQATQHHEEQRRTDTLTHLGFKSIHGNECRSDGSGACKSRMAHYC